ncbi:hypothetical protein F5B20DRAFT_267695 [Whalleya microplaca]|nr:hypothetical protein F5B20DRAFT_267695 [Whalleya microplaca]
MAEEPTLPRLPTVSWNSESQTFANTRKRAHDRVAASPLFSNSSDPAVFSSDDDAHVDNYAQGRHQKKRYVGSWYQQHLASSDSTFSESVQPQPRPQPKAKRTFERQFDSGVWMGSDASVDIEDDILADIQPLTATTLPQLRHARPTTTLSPSEAAARQAIQDAIDHGNETVDLSSSGIESLSNATISQLSEFSCIPLVTEDVPFEHKDPSLKIYLASNPLLRAPGALFNLEHLTVLSLRNTQITELPPSIRNLRNLETLNVSLTRLRYLPGELLDLMVYPSKLENLIIHPNPFFRPERTESDNDVMQFWSLPDSALNGRKFQVWLDKQDETQKHVACPPITGPGHAAWQAFALARSPVQYRDSRGVILSAFRLPRPEPYTDTGLFSEDIRIKTEALDSAPALPHPTRSSSQLTPPSPPKSRVPSLFELALQACSRTAQLRELPSYLPPQTPAHCVDALTRVTAQGEANANAGDLPCSVCARRAVVPLAEWIEWWDVSRVEVDRDSETVEVVRLSNKQAESGVPFLRRGCSWRCLPRRMRRGRGFPGTGTVTVTGPEA